MIFCLNEKKSEKQDGFCTLFLVAILSSLVFLFLVICKASCSHAAVVHAEEILAATGRSLLSEYDPVLFERYGIFALQSSERLLEEKARLYIQSDLSRSGITAMELNDCTVCGESTPGLNAELLEQQLIILGKEAAVYSLVSDAGIREAAEQFSVFADSSDAMQDQSSAGLEKYVSDAQKKASSARKRERSLKKEKKKLEKSLPENPSLQAQIDALDQEIEEAEEDAGNAKKTADQGENLLGQYRKALDPDLSGAQYSGSVIDLPDPSQLPTRLLGIESSVSLLLTGRHTDQETGPSLQDRLLIDEYLMLVCSNEVRQTSEPSECRNEIEYVLFGNGKYSTNTVHTKRCLFELRFAVELAGIYADPEELAAIQTASLAFSPVPQPLAAFVLASIRASVLAVDDINRLYKGEKVPLLPLSLASEGSFAELGYEDYLRIFLLLVPTETKVIRFMDIAQMNVNREEKGFRFRSCFYGVSLQVRFSGRSFPGGDPLFLSSEYSLTETYRYQ